MPAKNAGDKEGDADIIATFESLKLIVYVQAKCHDGETAGWAVEQVRRFVEYQSDNGEDDDFTRLSWVVSTAETFSVDCYEKARCGRVRLVDGLEFAEMLLDVGIENL